MITTRLSLSFFALIFIAALLVPSTAAFAGGQAKVAVCHIPPGNPANAHVIVIGAPAVPAHLNHGDTLGACDEPGDDDGGDGGGDGGGDSPDGGDGGGGDCAECGPDGGGEGDGGGGGYGEG